MHGPFLPATKAGCSEEPSLCRDRVTAKLGHVVQSQPVIWRRFRTGYPGCLSQTKHDIAKGFQTFPKCTKEPACRVHPRRVVRARCGEDGVYSPEQIGRRVCAPWDPLPR